MGGAASRIHQEEQPPKEWRVGDLVLARMAPATFYWGVACSPLPQHPNLNAVHIIDKRFNPWKPADVWPCGEFGRNLTAESRKSNAARLLQRRFRRYRLTQGIALAFLHWRLLPGMMAYRRAEHHFLSLRGGE